MNQHWNTNPGRSLSLPTFLSSCNEVLPLVAINTDENLALSSWTEGIQNGKQDTRKFPAMQRYNIGGMK